MNQRRVGTVCFLVKDNQVLLALIEYGEGQQIWNGIGGFIEVGENIEDGLIREAKEEIDIEIDKSTLETRAVLYLSEEFSLIVFIATKWTGEPKIIDPTLKELKWFPIDQLPLDKMHKDNDKWLPKILAGKYILATSDKDSITYREIPNLSVDN